MIEDYLLTTRGAGLTTLFSLFPHLVSYPFYLTIITIGYLSGKRELFRNLALLLCLETVLNGILKISFRIPRPDEHFFLLPIQDPFGFPSGDAQLVSAFFTYLTIALYPNRRFALFAILMITLTGISRIYLGVHSLSDVLMGIFVGITTTIAAMRIARHDFFEEILVKEPFQFVLIAVSFLFFLLFKMHHYLFPSYLLATGSLLAIVQANILFHRLQLQSKRHSPLFIIIAFTSAFGFYLALSHSFLGSGTNLLLAGWLLTFYLFFVIDAIGRRVEERFVGAAN